MSPSWSRSAQRIVPAIVVAVALVATACSGDDDTGPAGPATAAEPPPSEVRWEGCGSLECASISVPLDHDTPDGEHIDIAVSRHAADPDARIGVLIVNPGGPGASGIGLPASLADAHPDLAKHFDIIGFDPRGVGGSRELTCDDPLAAFYRLDNQPDDDAERTDLITAADAASDACADADPDFLPNIGTSAVVEDIDAIREALGEEQINYLGLSYGSVIGLLYTTRYGDRVRALVVDGVTDPAHDLAAWLTSQAVAADAALRSVIETCDGCDDGLADLAEAFERSETGLAAGDGVAGPSDVARAAILDTYSSPGGGTPSWLSAAADGDGTGALSRSNRYLSLAGFDVYTAVKCLDTQRPADAEAYLAFVDDATAAAPLLGGPIAMELLPCATWSVPSEPLEPIDDTLAPPILVLGNTGDAATPYGDAVAVVDRLDKAMLVTFEGTGHLSLGRGSACVDAATIAYLVDLVSPEPGVRCR